jgi:hypothetical protein
MQERLGRTGALQPGCCPGAATHLEWSLPWAATQAGCPLLVRG